MAHHFDRHCWDSWVCFQKSIYFVLDYSILTRELLMKIKSKSGMWNRHVVLEEIWKRCKALVYFPVLCWMLSVLLFKKKLDAQCAVRKKIRFLFLGVMNCITEFSDFQDVIRAQTWSDMWLQKVLQIYLYSY